MQPYRVLIKCFWLALIPIGLVTFGCSTARQINSDYSLDRATQSSEVFKTEQSAVVMGPPEVFGPPVPDSSPVYGPEPVPVRPLVLVLSPGMARGFAHIGVLEALSENKIPIAAILGTEMGALVGALYATSSTVNQFDWKVLRLKEEFFLSRSILGGYNSRSQVGSELVGAIQQVFSNKKLTDVLIPMYIAAPSKFGTFELLKDGALSRVVEQSLGGAWSNSSMDSQWTVLINYARSLNLGTVMIVDVLNAKDSGRVTKSLESADLEIRPDLTGIGYLDFNRKTEAAFRGKNAIAQKIEEIKRQVGRKDSRE